MNNSRIYLSDLITSFLDRHISIADSASSLFSSDKIKGTASLVRCIKKGLSEFERYMPMIVTKYIANETDAIEFHTNYNQWYESGSKSIEDLTIRPLAIASIGNGVISITSNYWRYQSGILYISPGTHLVKYVAKYPIYDKYTSDGYLTRDSHIYGVEDEEVDQFTNAIDLAILRAIQRREKIVNMPMSVNFLQLDSAINEVKELVDEDKSNASTLRCGWY